MSENMDQPNGNLKVGDIFKIVEWVADHAFVHSTSISHENGMHLGVVGLHANPDPSPGDKNNGTGDVRVDVDGPNAPTVASHTYKNRALMNCILRAEAISYPEIVCRVLSIQSGHNINSFVHIDLRKFEMKPCDNDIGRFYEENSSPPYITGNELYKDEDEDETESTEESAERFLWRHLIAAICVIVAAVLVLLAAQFYAVALLMKG